MLSQPTNCAKPGNTRNKFQSKYFTEPCKSGLRPRPAKSPLRQDFRPARSFVRGSNSSLSPLASLTPARERISVREQSHAAPGLRTPSLRIYHEVAAQYATDSKPAEGSSEPRSPNGRRFTVEVSELFATRQESNCAVMRRIVRLQ